MRAAIYDPLMKKEAGPTGTARYVVLQDAPRPAMQPGHVLLRVLACGVCRTDLHIVEGDLPVLRPSLIPGHQIVGEVVEGVTARASVRDARRCFVDGRSRWHLLVLPTWQGKSLR